LTAFVNRRVAVVGDQRLLDVRPVRIRAGIRPRQYSARDGGPPPFLGASAVLPDGGSPADEITFTQSPPAAVWIIPHNLGHYPSVTVIDVENERVLGEVSYPDIDVVVLTFSQPIAGIAYLV